MKKSVNIGDLILNRKYQTKDGTKIKLVQKTDRGIGLDVTNSRVPEILFSLDLVVYEIFKFGR